VVEILTRDAEALHRALDAQGDQVNVSLSRDTAELVARVVDARARGQQVLLTRGLVEVSPNLAAALLGMSRPQVRKLLDQGRLEFRKVGAHHRIRVESIQAFLDAERPRRRTALGDLARLQDELGLTQ
jgi:excisionase family DNA binding protein